MGGVPVQGPLLREARWRTRCRPPHPPLPGGWRPDRRTFSKLEVGERVGGRGRGRPTHWAVGARGATSGFNRAVFIGAPPPRRPWAPPGRRASKVVDGPNSRAEGEARGQGVSGQVPGRAPRCPGVHCR